MPVDDRARVNLLRQLDSARHRDANTSMSHLPPVTWNEIANKGDITILGTSVRGETHSL